MHLQRQKKSTPIAKEKWALAIADPIITDEKDEEILREKELASIKKTASLIRGIQLDQLAELPETKREALAIIGDNSETSSLLSRENAIKENIMPKNLSQYEIVSFSTHGLMAGETENNYHPAILLSKSDKGSLLTTDDILELNGSPKIVLLAICNASNNYNNLKTSEINNVANAFLMKGSDAIISTYWALNSDASVTIIKKALKYYNEGLDLNSAFQKSALKYKNSNPKSLPKDWGAFLVIGNSKKGITSKVKNYRDKGFIYDLSKINDRIYLLGKEKISVTNKNLEIESFIEFNKTLLKDEYIVDAKFIDQKHSTFLRLSNKSISLVHEDKGELKINRMHIPDDIAPLLSQYAPEYGFKTISSIAEHQGNILFAIIAPETPFVLMGKYNKENRKADFYFLNTKNNLDFDWQDASFHKVNNKIYFLNRFNTPNALNGKNFLTRSGISEYCKYKQGIDISIISPDFNASSDVEWISSQNGQLLPYFSRNYVTHMVAYDECSEKSSLNKMPNNLEKNFENEALIFKPYKIQLKSIFQSNSGNGPWRVNYFTEQQNVIIVSETFFPILTGINQKNEVINTYGELGYTGNNYGKTFNSVLYKDNGEKIILSNNFDCLLPSGLEEDGAVYAVCNEHDGQHSLRKYD